MVAQSQSQAFTAAGDVLGDALPSPKALGGTVGCKDLGLLRQRVIVHLLEQVPMAPASLYKTCVRLVRSGILTRESVPELEGLACDSDDDESVPQLMVGTSGQTADGRAEVLGAMEPAPHQPAKAHTSSTSASAVAPSGPSALGLPSRFEQDFERLELLGRGAYGEVWRCRHRLDGREYAVKAVQYRASASDAGRVERRVTREAATWAAMSHENVVRYHSAWVEVDWATPAPEHGTGPLPLPPAMSLGSTGISTADRSGTGVGADSEAWDESDDSIIFAEPGEAPDDLARAASTPASAEGLGVVPAVADAADFRAARPLPRHIPSYRATLYIQTELCSKDTLMSWIAQRNAAVASGLTTQEDHLRWARQAVDIFQQCTVALSDLHAKKCVHRDVKPSNILFGRDGSVRLGDFGLAKVLDGPLLLQDDSLGFEEECAAPARAVGSGHTRAVGTPSYSSPEQLADRPYGLETDVYALGMILAELLCPVGTQMERAALLESLRHGRRLPSEVAAAFPATVRLVMAMTHPDPLRRPAVSDLLKAYPDVAREVQQRLGTKLLLDIAPGDAALPAADEAVGKELPEPMPDQRRPAIVATEVLPSVAGRWGATRGHGRRHCNVRPGRVPRPLRRRNVAPGLVLAQRPHILGRCT